MCGVVEVPCGRGSPIATTVIASSLNAAASIRLNRNGQRRFLKSADARSVDDRLGSFGPVLDRRIEKHHGTATPSRSTPSRSRPRAGWAILAGAGLAGVAALNHRLACEPERANPSKGRFVEVDGLRVHYLDRGHGEPVVLVHGNGSSVEDPACSGPIDRAAPKHGVIAFERPGFGTPSRLGRRSVPTAPRATGSSGRAPRMPTFLRDALPAGTKRPRLFCSPRQRVVGTSELQAHRRGGESPWIIVEQD